MTLKNKYIIFNGTRINNKEFFICVTLVFGPVN